MSEAIRSFIAVPMPAETVEKLMAVQTQLRPAARNVKWVSADSLHVTLKFLGVVEPARLHQTWESVQEALAETKRFTLLVRGVGAFPSRTRVRVIWAGIEQGTGALAEMTHSIEGTCQQHGFEPESRPFQAHITMGRVREPVVNQELAQKMEEFAQEQFGEVNVDRVLLMKSELTPKGAHYTVLEQHLLTAPETSK